MILPLPGGLVLASGSPVNFEPNRIEQTGFKSMGECLVLTGCEIHGAGYELKAELARSIASIRIPVVELVEATLDFSGMRSIPWCKIVGERTPSVV